MTKEHLITYRNSTDNINKVVLKEGKLWSRCATSNQTLNSIFQEADDGDGIVSKYEIQYVKNKISDVNKDGIYDNEEIRTAYNTITRDALSENKSKEIAKTLNDDVCAKSKFLIPTTGKDFGVHILDIKHSNVVSVLSNYKNIEKTSLFSAIMNEFELDFDEQAKYCKYIFNQLLRQAVEKTGNSSKISKIVKEFDNELATQYGRPRGFKSGKKLNEIANELVNIIKSSQTIEQKTVATKTAIGATQKQLSSSDVFFDNPKNTITEFKEIKGGAVSARGKHIYRTENYPNGKTKTDFIKSIIYFDGKDRAFVTVSKYAESGKLMYETKFETDNLTLKPEI